MSTSLRQPDDGCRPGPFGLIARIGGTPLIRLDRVCPNPDRVELYGKAEWLNPGGSVKDRPAIRMILEGEQTGALRPGKTILDATSGNTGIAYAWIGALKGYPVRLVVPANASQARKKLLRAYGADVIYTDPGEGIDAAIELAAELFRSDPDRYFYPDQYRNPANWMAHYDGTAGEIWEDTGGRVTHFVAGLGTSGTFVGVTRRLKELDAAVRCVSVEPDAAFHGLEGLKHMESAMAPGIYDPHLADCRLQVRTEDAYTIVRRLAREEGLLVSPSAGAAVAASLEIASSVPKNGNALIVTILPDSGEKYLSERFWSEG